MQLPYLSNRQSYEDAARLIEEFGDRAGHEALLRADAGRDMGNHITFCHWRQIERMILVMSIDKPIGTVH